MTSKNLAIRSSIPGDGIPEEVRREFHSLLKVYLESGHRRRVEVIERAFKLAVRAYKGSRMADGRPRILHSIGVARIVAGELNLGSTSICAALLHEALRQTEVTATDILNQCGAGIASIVENLNKISGGILGHHSSAQAENLRNLLLSMSADVRVVLVKMADRLHNMRNPATRREDYLQRVANETLYLYAPLAHRLGLFRFKTEFEERAFAILHPRETEEIQKGLALTEEARARMVEEFAAPIKERLLEEGIKSTVKGRVKSVYSIWNKMQKKQIPFSEIFDIYAIRIIFECGDAEKENEICRRIYGIVTEGRRVHPDRLRDWLETPKPNGYRAMHVTVGTLQGGWAEVQIRSRRMDEIAELGCAAHWKYKNMPGHEDSREFESHISTIKRILESPDPEKVDLLSTFQLAQFSPQIYVFTPKEELIALPAGATVADMAYAVHSDLGQHCVAGKVNRRLYPISHPLSSGDKVEIITSRTQEPQKEWLDFCVTPRARAHIRAALRHNG